MKHSLLHKASIFVIALLVSFSSFAQQKKQDSLIVQIQTDTATYKYVLRLIQENIPNNTVTGQTILANIFSLFQSAKLVANEAYHQKDIPNKEKPKQ